MDISAAGSGSLQMNRVDLPDWVQGNFRALLDAVPDAILVVNDAKEVIVNGTDTDFIYSGSWKRVNQGATTTSTTSDARATRN